MNDLTALEREALDGLIARRPDLQSCVPALGALHDCLVACFDRGGKLLTCGNGGSHADAMHIVGELCKSFERQRPLPGSLRAALKEQPHGEVLVDHLESGLPAVTLGLNGSLRSAVENDSKQPYVAYAQEACALLKPGDVLLAISTSGNAMNCCMALSVAKAIGATTAAFTGPHGGEMAQFAEIVMKAPGDTTKVVQEAHIALYHTMCLMVEAHYFPEAR